MPTIAGMSKVYDAVRQLARESASLEKVCQQLDMNDEGAWTDLSQKMDSVRYLTDQLMTAYYGVVENPYLNNPDAPPLSEACDREGLIEPIEAHTTESLKKAEEVTEKPLKDMGWRGMRARMGLPPVQSEGE